MSYILDALKKADAQRVRDPARGIHAQAALAMPAPGERERRRIHLLWGATAVLLVAAGGWLWVGGQDKGVVPLAVNAVPAATPPSPASPSPATTVLPAPVPVPAALVIVPPAPVESRLPTTVIVTRQALPAAAPPATAASAISASVTARPGPTDRTYKLAELPSDVQQAWPKFAISGGVYSENVTQRMLIVNGQVFNEGSEIAPGVVLEQVRPKAALLKFRGLRISQPY